MRRCIGVIAVIDIPIVHLSVLWMNSLHQLPTVHSRRRQSRRSTRRWESTLLVSVIAFTLVYFAFLAERMSIELDRQRRMLEARVVIENLGFIVAAYVLVWGGIAVYLISLRRRRGS